MSAIWTVYLVVSLGLVTLALLLVRELDPKDRPIVYWRVLDSLLVVFGIALLLALLIEVGVLATSV
jgi:hypothetical protein